MKIRNDFVSNSSSSSFVLFGSEITKNELSDLYKRQKGLEDENCEDGINVEKAYDDLIWGKFDVALLDDESKAVYAGAGPDKMKNNETLKDFKQKIADKFAKIGLRRTVKDIEFMHGINENGILYFDD